MSDNTAAQADLHPDLVHREAWRVIEIAAAHSAVGWKVNGAGGDGGSITLLCGAHTPSKPAMIQAILQEHPAFQSIPVAISHEGLRVWEGH
jgi:D-glycero-alpha-D-manno-heptose-7-phosphate kinase